MEMSEQEKEYINIKVLNCRERTVLNYNDIIKKFHREIKKHIEDITYDDFCNFIKTIDRLTVRNMYIIFIKNFYKELDLDIDKKFRKIKVKKYKPNKVEYKEKVVTEDEYKTMLNYAHNPRDKALIEMFYISGFRAKELKSIKLNGVKFFDDYTLISCTDSKNEKGIREIEIMTPIPHIKDYIELYHNKDDEYLFNIKYTSSINRIFDDICKKAGLKHITCHDFRHTKATVLSEQGLTEQAIKEFMGWEKDSPMLLYYEHNDMQNYRQQIREKLGNKAETMHTVKKERDYYKTNFENLLKDFTQLKQEWNTFKQSQ